MRPMSTAKPIHIFKPGTHTAMSGAVLDFTESDLRASAQAYDPSLHEAPLVVGHPKADAPAYGWVSKLAFTESGLQAEPHQIDTAFAELVNAGRFKKVSASFYPPESPANPVPGVYYLRHVGFLGAQPPAIKGLKQAEFSDGADCITLEFAEYDDVTNAGLWRGMREWFIGKFGAEEADKVVPQYAVQQLEQSAQDELKESAMESTDGILPAPAFTETLTGDPMAATTETISPEKYAELMTENAKLKQQQADFAEQQKNAKTAADHVAHVAFAEGLVKDGRLLPAHKDQAVAMLDYLAGQDAVIEFGEGDAKKPLLDAVKNDWLAKAPKIVEFGEHYADDGSNAETLDFASPDNLPVETASMRVHQQAEAYAAHHKVDYLTAVLAVSKR